MITLVRPPVIFPAMAVGNEATPCIGLAYIAGYLRDHGYDPFIIDGMVDALNEVWSLKKYPGFQCQGLRFSEIIDRIPKETKIIGIRSMFSGEWPVVRDLIFEIKKHFPNVIIVAGGEHITAMTEYSLRDCNVIDYCVIGEGERAFYHLCDALFKGNEIKKINALAYLDRNGEYYQTSSVTRINNINQIPWPYWPDGYLEKFWDAGKSFGIQTARDMPMMITRGCPYECTFCSNPFMYTRKYVVRDIDDIISEIKYYIKKYDITGIQLYDLTAVVKRDWMIELLRAVIDNKINVNWQFPSGTRSEALDKEVLELLKQVGTGYICYAPESGSGRSLRKMKKKIDLDKMTKSIHNAKKLGLTVRANIIIGFPFETRKDILKSIWYALKLTAKGVDDIQPYIYSPYPGTELFNELVNDGSIIVNDEYFFSLIGLNSDLTNFKPLVFTKNINAWELAIYRLLFTLFAYGISYLLKPSRFVRTMKNLYSKDNAETVFEARLKGIIHRKDVDKVGGPQRINH